MDKTLTHPTELETEKTVTLKNEQTQNSRSAGYVTGNRVSYVQLSITCISAIATASAAVAAWKSALNSANSSNAAKIAAESSVRQADISDKSLREMQKNVELMKNNWELSRQEFQLRTRPYLSIDLKTSDPIGKELWLVNYGDVPAVRVKIRRRTVFRLMDKALLVYQGSSGDAHYSLRAREERAYSPHRIGDESLIAFLNRGWRMEEYVLVDYWDGSGTRHFQDVKAWYFDKTSPGCEITYKDGKPEGIRYCGLVEGPFEMCNIQVKRLFSISPPVFHLTKVLEDLKQSSQ